MVGWLDIQEWDPAPFDDVLERVLASRTNVVGVVDELERLSFDAWRGAGGDAARERLADVQMRSEHVADCARRLVMAFAEAQDGVAQVRSKVLDASALFERYQFEFVDGAVFDPRQAALEAQRQAQLSPLSSGGMVTPVDTEIDIRLRARGECQALVDEAVTRANVVEADLAAALRGLKALEDFDPDAPTTMGGVLYPFWPLKGLRPDPSPSEVAAWVLMQDEDELIELANKYPRLMGGLDGMPGKIRDIANRNYLEDEMERVDVERGNLADRVAGMSHIEKYNPHTFDGLSLEYRDLLERSEELEDYASEMRTLQGEIGPSMEILSTAQLNREGRQLLVFDPPTGEDGHTRLHAAVGVGDIDQASHIVVNTPGTGTTVADSITGEVKRMENLRLSTDRELSRALQGESSVASVAWLGYDAPQGVFTDATQLRFAEQAAARNGEFLDGIHYSRLYGTGEDARLVSIGHSYGSTAAGMGAGEADPGVVDAFVAYGTPGLDDGVLDVPANERYVVQFDDDIIEVANMASPGGAVHGYHPRNDPTFVNVDPGEPALESENYFTNPGNMGIQDPNNLQSTADMQALGALQYSGEVHSAYLIDQSESQKQISRIIAGLDVDIE